MRNIPADNLAYPVLITWDTGSTGSGFVIATDKISYFVTAKHCLFDNKGQLLGSTFTLLCQMEDIDDDSYGIFEISIQEVQANGNLFKHHTHDVAGFILSTLEILENQKHKNTIAPGVKIVQHANSPLVSVHSKDAICFLKDILISNNVFIYGYPVSLGLAHSPQFEYNKPLLRKGIIANVNKKQGTIILDAPVYYGNSGGPVVQVYREGLNTKHRVIGIVSEFIPYYENWLNQSNGLMHTEASNSGYSVAVAMDYVFEMLKLPINNL